MQNPTEDGEAPIPMETVSSHIIRMQNPTQDDEAPIRIETMSSNNGPDIMNRTVAVGRRKAVRRTLPFDLQPGEIQLLPPGDDAPARKKPRLEEPLPTTPVDQAARETASPDPSVVGLPPPHPPPAANDDDDDDDDDANTSAGPVTDTQPNAVATRATFCPWTLEEDAELTRVVANTTKNKMYANEYYDTIVGSSRVERKSSVGIDGVDSCIPESTRRIDGWVHGQQTKTAS
jgi:hypothetical protein